MRRPLLLAVLLTSAVPVRAQFPVLVDGVYGGGGISRVLDVVADASGTTYVAGAFSGTVDFDPADGPDGGDTATSNGATDAFVASYGPDGAFRWVAAFGGTWQEFASGLATDGARVYVSGSFSESVDFDPGPGTDTHASAGGYDAFVAAYNAGTGSHAWAHAFGSADEDGGQALAVDASGVFLAGTFTGTVDLDPGPGTATHTSTGPTGPDTFVAAYGPATGAHAWSHAIPTHLANASGYAAAEARGGRLFLTGSFTGAPDFDPGPGTAVVTGQGFSDAYVAAYAAATGAYAWAFALGGTGFDAGYALTTDGARVYVGGNVEGTVDFDPGPGSAVHTSSRAVYLAAYDQAGGAFDWVSPLSEGGFAYFSPFGLATEGERVYMAGNFSGTVDFDPGPGSVPVIWHGDAPSFTDAFLAAYEADSGGYAWVSALKGPGPDAANAAVVVGPHVFVAGAFSQTIDLDPGPGEDVRSGNGLFISPYDAATGAYLTTVASEPGAVAAGLALAAAPNPARGAATVTLTLDRRQAVTVTVFDVLGRAVARLHEGVLPAGAHPLAFDAGRLPAGVYVVRADTPGGAVSRPLTVGR